MPRLRYRNYYISVFHVPDKSGNSSCIPCLEIRHKLDHGPAARLTLSDAFGSAPEATEHGFAVGRRWVDDRLANPSGAEPLRGSASEESGDSPAPDAVFKTRPTSLPARLFFLLFPRLARAGRRG